MAPMPRCGMREHAFASAVSFTRPCCHDAQTCLSNIVPHAPCHHLPSSHPSMMSYSIAREEASRRPPRHAYGGEWYIPWYNVMGAQRSCVCACAQRRALPTAPRRFARVASLHRGWCMLWRQRREEKVQQRCERMKRIVGRRPELYHHERR